MELIEDDTSLPGPHDDEWGKDPQHKQDGDRDDDGAHLLKAGHLAGRVKLFAQCHRSPLKNVVRCAYSLLPSISAIRGVLRS